MNDLVTIEKRLAELRKKVQVKDNRTPAWKTADEVSSHNRVFLLDVSSSMQGSKIKAARIALERYMRPEDGLFVFGNDVRYVEKAQIYTIQADGMTAMLPAFEDGMKCRPMHFVLISDGEPNVDGDPEDVLNFMARFLAVRVDCIGIRDKNNYSGYDREFLEKLAKQNSGRFMEVENPDLIGEAVKAICYNGTIQIGG